MYSDTPQGALTGVESETYLTNARKVTDSGNSQTDVDETVTDNGTSEVKGVTSQTINSKLNNREIVLVRVLGVKWGVEVIVKC